MNYNRLYKMGEISKQLAIYICLVLVCAAYTMIAPFYPSIAKDKGVPIWLIGVVFSTDPFFGFLSSLVIAKKMNKIGRKNVLILSQVFLCLSMFALSPIQYCDLKTLIILSFVSRMLAGIGTGCVMTAAPSVFASDYPDKIPVMMGRMQGAVGIGLILGPLLGTVLYFDSLFLALAVLGIVIAVFIPIAWNLLGKFNDYELTNQKYVSARKLFLIPVISI